MNRSSDKNGIYIYTCFTFSCRCICCGWLFLGSRVRMRYHPNLADISMPTPPSIQGWTHPIRGRSLPLLRGGCPESGSGTVEPLGGRAEKAGGTARQGIEADGRPTCWTEGGTGWEIIEGGWDHHQGEFAHGTFEGHRKQFEVTSLYLYMYCTRMCLCVYVYVCAHIYMHVNHIYI